MSELVPSFLWLTGISVGLFYVKEAIGWGKPITNTGMPDGIPPGVKMFGIPIIATALGFWWFGALGAVGGLAGSFAAWYVYRDFLPRF